MFPSEEVQRKRRNESTNENSAWAFEKKQRVEQLVTALARPDKKNSISSTPPDTPDNLGDDKV